MGPAHRGLKSQEPWAKISVFSHKLFVSPFPPQQLKTAWHRMPAFRMPECKQFQPGENRFLLFPATNCSVDLWWWTQGKWFRCCPGLHRTVASSSLSSVCPGMRNKNKRMGQASCNGLAAHVPCWGGIYDPVGLQNSTCQPAELLHAWEANLPISFKQGIGTCIMITLHHWSASTFRLSASPIQTLPKCDVLGLLCSLQWPPGSLIY